MGVGSDYNAFGVVGYNGEQGGFGVYGYAGNINGVGVYGCAMKSPGIAGMFMGDGLGVSTAGTGIYVEGTYGIECKAIKNGMSVSAISTGIELTAGKTGININVNAGATTAYGLVMGLGGAAAYAFSLSLPTYPHYDIVGTTGWGFIPITVYGGVPGEYFYLPIYATSV